ncbi:MAG: four helix bundle protein [Bacteroidales bacterium]|nr:four helix bundle protein [Bacteroidales bacterium]
MEINTDSRTSNDLQDRLFNFAVDVIKLIRKLPKGKEYDIISYQLIKSSTSSGANYEEAQGAVSKPDFANKVGISLKEMLESSYWIRLIVETTTERSHNWEKLLNEATELKKILGSIYSKTSIKR